QTLNDLQKLLGTVNWIRPLLGLSKVLLAPLFDLLKGDPYLLSPRSLSPEALEALKQVELAIQGRKAWRVVTTIPLSVYILLSQDHPVGLIAQWHDIFLLYQRKKMVTTHLELIAHVICKARQWCVQLSGREPAIMTVPLTSEYWDWCMANSSVLQMAMVEFPGKILFHRPAHKFLQMHLELQIVESSLYSSIPLQGRTVFTNGSGRTGKVVVTWKEGDQWHDLIGRQDGSPQLAELWAVIMAFEAWPYENLNVVYDSQYVCNIVRQLDRAVLKEINNKELFYLLKTLWHALCQRTAPFYILHVRSHTNLPGFIVEGNARADKLTAPAWAAPVPDTLQQAIQSHQFFHQGACVLRHQFHLTSAAARDIVASCSDCQQRVTMTHDGTTPRGLQALQLWQSDVTHISEFGRLKDVHISVDTYSKACWASVHAGEK
ncbi:POK19 protein, partial [Cnemophilus loriae]|nr:POK19 protein [Cnemophilus loriae]